MLLGLQPWYPHLLKEGLLLPAEEPVEGPLKADASGEGVCPSNLESKSLICETCPTGSNHASCMKLSYREDVCKDITSTGWPFLGGSYQ